MRRLTFDDILEQKRVLVCVGSGGVGKTTTAAALALEGARRGRKTLVMTIDPAKRLASSLGLPQLDHEERRVPDDLLATAGVKGTLHAMMLDQKRAFDEVVERYARDPQVRERVLANPIYKQISSTLSGSHEYAAMAKLYQIEKERDYDLIVVDTPPTAHALDFLDAPQKIASAVESPAIEWFQKPLQSTGIFSLKMVGRGGSFVMRRIAKFVGSAFLEDMARFFVEAADVLRGFRERAREVYELLRQPRVGFVLVASPEPTTVDEALFFHQKLASAGMPFVGFVVNRVHAQAPAAPSEGALVEALSKRPELASFAPYELARAAEAIREGHAEVGVLADADRREIVRLGQVLQRDQALVEVPFLARDVHDIEGLGLIGTWLFPGRRPS
jgi:anion-transporting  ArsA/GET3 family ATPase